MGNGTGTTKIWIFASDTGSETNEREGRGGVDMVSGVLDVRPLLGTGYWGIWGIRIYVFYAIVKVFIAA